MRYGLRISVQARQDLLELWRGLAEFSGLTKADRRLGQIEKKFQLLTQFPRSGPSRDDLCPGLRSYPAGDFVIFYRICETSVEVVRGLNGRRDIEALFQDPDMDA